MKKVLHSAVMSLLLGVGSLTAVSSSMANTNYPEKPVRIVVPYSPGGAVDSVTRMVAVRLSSELGQFCR